MRLFGKEIQLRSHECSYCGLAQDVIRPYVNLYVKVTNSCNASCPFCSNQNCTESADFDADKFFRILNEICNSDIRLNRISFTGGEPTIESELVIKYLDQINDNPNLDSTQIQINTNLLTPESHKVAIHPRIDSISVSRHHPDGFLGKNDSQYFSGIPSQKLNLSCVIVKGMNDRAETARAMMDFALANQIPHLGFVELLPVNNYAQTHHVSLSEINWVSIPGLRKMMEHRNGSVCRCANYVYCSDGGLLDVYMRNYADSGYCESSLLFDGQHLRQGFKTDNIIY